MDPNAALLNIRAKISELGDSMADMSCECDQASLASELADLVDGLDQWLTRGGFKPAAWS